MTNFFYKSRDMIKVLCMTWCVYIYIYIYIYRQRERERELMMTGLVCMVLCYLEININQTLTSLKHSILQDAGELIETICCYKICGPWM